MPVYGIWSESILVRIFKTKKAKPWNELYFSLENMLTLHVEKYFPKSPKSM